MSIVERIIRQIEQATGRKCYYQSKEVLNGILDYGAMPCCFFTLLRSQQVNIDMGNIRERVQIAVFFADTTEFDFAAIENEDIIETQKQAAFAWLLSLRRADELRLISVDGSERAYAEYDAILTGYALRVTIEELYGVRECVKSQILSNGK